jgi:CHAT domain-containing protein
VRQRAAIFALLLVALVVGCKPRVRRTPPVVASVVSRELGRATDAPLDRAVEVSFKQPSTVVAGALFVFDEHGRPLAAPLPFVTGSARTMRAVVNRRALSPYAGRAAGVVLIGSPPRVHDAVARLANAPRASLDHLAGLRRLDVTLDAAPLGIPFDAARVDAAEALLTTDPGQALASMDAMRGAATGADAARIDVVAAEAAFAFGRTRLAAILAQRGLSLVTLPTHEARLLRVLVLVDIEESANKETPPARARLAATAPLRTDPMEIALDAALDVRVAETHDRTFPADPHAPAAARAFIAAFGQIGGDRTALAAALCRAARHVADGTKTDEAIALLETGASLAHEAGLLTAEVMCAIKAGDVARAFGRHEDAAARFEHARALLGDRPLPREQREAAYSAALLAEARGDHREALRAGLVACRFVDRLLAMESDLAAREALVSNVVGYYGATELHAVHAGDPALAIAIGEAGKGRALSVLLAGPSGIDATPDASWVEARELASDDYAARIGALAAALGPDDAAISIVQVGKGAQGTVQHGIGVVTREGVHVVVTSHTQTFLADVIAHGEAIERNDAEAARVLGARIYDELLRPSEALWAGKTRLLVSPNRKLQSLSWAALHDGRQWLVERVAIARVPPFLTTAHDPKDDSVRLRALRWMFVLDPSHPPLDRLPGLEMVGATLATKVSPSVVLRGPEVTAARFLSRVENAGALLYAGHAEYRAERPLQSALLVAPSTGDPEGKIYAWSALGIAHPPELVLLIGCESARLWKTNATFSDDFIGLPRAFLAAGARHVVGALWPVVDRDAEDFLRAVFAMDADVDPVRTVGQAQACLAAKRCFSRGIAAWASYVVDAR